MANIEQMMSVADNCSLYDAYYNDIAALASSTVTKSCMTCSHFKEGECKKHVFDDVLAGLDTI